MRLSILVIFGILQIFISSICAQTPMQTQEINFDDIYQMEVILQLVGNVDIIATDRDNIVATYPESVTLETMKNGDTLTVKPML